MQTTITICITGENCEEKKTAIAEHAKQKEKSVSKFLVGLFDQFVEKEQKGRTPERHAFKKRGA
jgi:hypothetical protein